MRNFNRLLTGFFTHFYLILHFSSFLFAQTAVDDFTAPKTSFTNPFQLDSVIWKASLSEMKRSTNGGILWFDARTGVKLGTYITGQRMSTTFFITQGGYHLTSIDTGYFAVTYNVWDVVLNTSSYHDAFAVYRTTDGGINWNKIIWHDEAQVGSFSFYAGSGTYFHFERSMIYNNIRLMHVIGSDVQYTSPPALDGYSFCNKYGGYFYNSDALYHYFFGSFYEDKRFHAITDVDFADPLNGAIAANDSVYITNDGGASWSVLRAGSGKLLFENRNRLLLDSALVYENAIPEIYQHPSQYIMVSESDIENERTLEKRIIL